MVHLGALVRLVIWDYRNESIIHPPKEIDTKKILFFVVRAAVDICFYFFSVIFHVVVPNSHGMLHGLEQFSSS